MIPTRTKEEIKIMSKAGSIAEFALRQIVKEVKEGVTTLELEKIARRLISARGAEPAFLGYNGYPAAICVSINDELVHGIPSARKIKKGDLIGIDLGVKYKGYFSDTAKTVSVGRPSQDASRLMNGTKEALLDAIRALKPGIRIGDLENTIGETLKKYNLEPVLALSGHGIGKEIHEKPVILCDGRKCTGNLVKEGMVFAIEPMATLGNGEVITSSDGWTVKTKDKSLSAHFEHTVLVTKSGPRVLTGKV